VSGTVERRKDNDKISFTVVVDNRPSSCSFYGILIDRILIAKMTCVTAL